MSWEIINTDQYKNNTKPHDEHQQCKIKKSI